MNSMFFHFYLIVVCLLFYFSHFEILVALSNIVQHCLQHIKASYTFNFANETFSAVSSQPGFVPLFYEFSLSWEMQKA